MAGDVDGLLQQLPRAVEAQLGRTDNLLSRDVKYQLRGFGATRLKRDGTVRVGRQDRKALEQLVSGAGDRQDPETQARAAKALDNVMRAHLERLPGAIAGDGGKGHSRGIGGAAAAGIAMTPVGAAVGSTNLIGKPMAEFTRVVVNDMAEIARTTFTNLGPGGEVWATTPTAAQTMGAFATLAAVTGAASYLDERSDRLGEQRAVPAAWTQAHGAAVRDRLGVSLPDAPLSSAEVARAQAVAATAQRLGELTGSDRGAVLTQLASAPAAEHQQLIVRSLAPASSSERQAEVLGEMARTRVSGSSRNVAMQAGTVDRAVRATLTVDAKHGGTGQFADSFPSVDPSLAPKGVLQQSGGDGPALSGLTQAGSTRTTGEAPIARRAGTDGTRQTEGRTGPNG